MIAIVANPFLSRIKGHSIASIQRAAGSVGTLEDNVRLVWCSEKYSQGAS